jgi:hypothetical protein
MVYEATVETVTKRIDNKLVVRHQQESITHPFSVLSHSQTPSQRLQFVSDVSVGQGQTGELGKRVGLPVGAFPQVLVSHCFPASNWDANENQRHGQPKNDLASHPPKLTLSAHLGLTFELRNVP